MRQLRIHALKGNGQELFAGFPYCEDNRAREFTMRPWYEQGRDVTCLRCLYYTGRYMPLYLLDEHQRQMKVAASLDRTGSFCT